MSKIITINDLIEKAKELGGECLSSKYLGARHKYQWRGPSGRIFEAPWNFVKTGKRWDKISRETYTIASLKQEALKRSGKCLSGSYSSNKAKYKWQCSIGCVWEASWMDVLAGSWCPWCSKRLSASKRADKIEDLHKHASEKGGKCLSETYKNQVTYYQWECKKGHIWDAQWTFVKHALSWCPECPISKSKDELDLLDFVKDKFCEAKTFVFSPKKHKNKSHIDIFIKSKNVGIEYNGLYWHNETANKTRLHINKKRLMCEENGIRLITVFEDEWLSRKTQVKGFLSSVLGIHSKIVYARKCDIEEVELYKARQFLEDNHIQGFTNSIVAFGLYYEDELLAVMTGGKHHRNNKDFVLNRFALKSGVHIPGGASRLFKKLCNFAKESGVTKIVSWSDNRWSQGNVYRKLGFILESELPPDYSYVQSNSSKGRLSKQSCKKQNLLKKGAKGSTEKEMAKSLGLSRIWDCGKKRWIFNL